MADMMGGPVRPQYADAVQALTPVLLGLPGKLVAIDGRPGAGKTTLGRFLAWRFNITHLETDLFLMRGQGRLIRRNDEIVRIIDGRVKRADPRPIIVDGVNVLQLLEAVQRPPDFLIHVSDAALPTDDLLNLQTEVEDYEAQFDPWARANLCIDF